jgi:hypothetical protein
LQIKSVEKVHFVITDEQGNSQTQQMMDILNVDYSPKSSKRQVYSKSTIKFDFGSKTKRNSIKI